MTLRPHTPLSSLLRAGFAALLLVVATVPALANKGYKIEVVVTAAQR